MLDPPYGLKLIHPTVRMDKEAMHKLTHPPVEVKNVADQADIPQQLSYSE